jgi:hypothetical protein
MFIGTLDGGGTFTIDTDFTPGKAGVQTVKVGITYQDNFKNMQTITREIPITVAAQASAQGQQGAIAATQAAARGTAGSAAQTGSETFWQVLLRFIRGMIGFDSAPDRTSIPNFNFSFPAGSATATPTK